MKEPTTSMERVLTALDRREPDRVPLFLLLTMHGARELGMTLEEYFSKPENVAEAQVRMVKKYNNDAMVPYYYAAIEAEAWGCRVITRPDGPATAGEPIIKRFTEIDSLTPPDLSKSEEMKKTVKSIELMKEKTSDAVPIIATTISPFSLPVMQLGFDKYIELMFEDEERFRKLIELNKAFSAEWIKMQISAGAHAVTYFDPVSSPTIIPARKYLQTGFPIAKEMVPRFGAAVAFHFASGKTLPIMEQIIQSGAKVMSISHEEDLGEAKRMSKGRIALIGNLNGVEMRKWSEEKVVEKVTDAIGKAGPGGGFVLSDSHGEIPFQVPEKTLEIIAETVREYGVYPLQSG